MRAEAYKLFRQLKNGDITSLFINKTARLETGVMLPAESYPTKGYKVRPYWHCTRKPEAPHLSTKGRVWRKVIMYDYKKIQRPAHQGGVWYLAKSIVIL